MNRQSMPPMNTEHCWMEWPLNWLVRLAFQGMLFAAMFAVIFGILVK